VILPESYSARSGLSGLRLSACQHGGCAALSASQFAA
jgi:hypothetical protein